MPLVPQPGLPSLVDALFAESSSARCLVGPDGTVVRANGEWLRAAGSDPERTIGAQFPSLYPAAREAVAAAQEGRTTRVVLPSPTGGAPSWTCEIAPVAMDGGTGLLVTARAGEVPGEKRRAGELKRLADQRQLALDAARMGWWHYDPDTRVATYDARYVEIFGVGGHERPNDEILSLLDPEDLPRVWAAVEAALDPARAEPYSTTYRIHRPDGEMRWVEAHGRATFEGEGASRRATSLVGTVNDVTDRRRADDALRESSGLLGAISDSSTDVIFAKDRRGRLRFANPATLALIGKPLAEVLGRTDAELLEDREAARDVMANDRRIMETGVPEELEERVPLADGTERVWLSRKAPYRDPASGQVIGLFGISRDITDRTRAVEALQASEARLQLALNAARMSAWELDPATGRVTLSHNAGDVVAMRDGRLHENSDQGYALIHPDDVEQHRALVDGALARGDGYVSTYRHLDGTRVLWLEERGQAVTDASGRTVRLVGVTQNITERKRAEDALRASEERWNAAIENFSEGAIIATEDEQVIYWNPAARAMHGFTTDHEGLEPLFRTPATFELWTADGSRLLGLDDWPMRRIKRGETVRRLELRLRRPDQGWERVVSYSGARVRTANGDRLMFVSVSDLTEQRRAETALREADRRKDEFLAMLAHELRNPLAAIRTTTYLLRRARPDSDQAGRARDIIDRQTNHLARLVDDLLDVTRVARGKIELRRERLDLREVVARAADDARLRMDENGVGFRLELPDRALWVDADPTRVAQIVGNLLHNAAKFTRPGDEVVVSVAGAGSEAELRVRDTGAGIEPELLPHVFEPFVQAQQPLARTLGGLGLGLALVKGIAELHGGGVRAESDGSGRGARFVVRLPLAVELAVPAIPAADERRPAKAGRRVLIIDDNADVAESLAELLRMLGHTAHVELDGAAGVEHARTHAPDVVLCDIGLPGMSGYDVARAIRALGRAMRLFAVSGYAQPEDVRRSAEAGFDAHVAKPPDLAHLERLLEASNAKA